MDDLDTGIQYQFWKMYVIASCDLNFKNHCVPLILERYEHVIKTEQKFDDVLLRVIKDNLIIKVINPNSLKR